MTHEVRINAGLNGITYRTNAPYNVALRTAQMTAKAVGALSWSIRAII